MITVADKTAWDKIMAENAGKAVSDLDFAAWPERPSRPLQGCVPACVFQHAGMCSSMQLLQNTRMPLSVGLQESLSVCGC